MTDQTQTAATAGTATETQAPAAAATLATGTTGATPRMKFKMKTTIGFDNGPAFGISTKSAVVELEGNSMQEIMTKALQTYVEKFGREPSGFAKFQMALVLDNGVEKGDNTKA